MIGRQRNLHADHFPDLADPVREPFDPLVGDFNARERVHHAVAAAEARASRHRERAGHVAHQADAEVLLQVRDAAIHALTQQRGLFLRILALRRVSIEPHTIAELAAEHLPAGDAPGLSGKIHQGHLDPAHAARLTRVMAELLDLAKHFIDAARVLAEDAALEEERIDLVRSVAHFAPPADALIRIDSNQRACKRGARDDGDAHIGNLQSRRLGCTLHVCLHHIRCGISRGIPGEGHRTSRPETERLEEGPAVNRRRRVFQHLSNGSFHRSTPKN
jgi:hypothetical protein